MNSQLKKIPSWIYIELITIGLALSSKFILKLDANIGWLTFFIGTNITIVSNSLERKIISTVQEFTQEEINKLNDGLKLYQLRSEIKDIELIPYADQTINKCIKELEDYKTGIGKVDHNRYSQKMSQCKKSVKAIFWGEDVKKILNLQLNNEDPLAIKYYEANLAAQKRGVDIIRIFVVDQLDKIVKEKIFSEQVWAFLQDHQKQGLTTKIIGINTFKRLISEENFTLMNIRHIHNPFQDFVIYDDTEIMIQDHIDNVAYSILIKNNNDMIETYKKFFYRLERNSLSLDLFKATYSFLK